MKETLTKKTITKALIQSAYVLAAHSFGAYCLLEAMLQTNLIESYNVSVIINVTVASVLLTTASRIE